MNKAVKAAAWGFVCTCLFASASYAQPKFQDPWFGTWVTKSATLTFTPWEDGIKMVHTADNKRIVAFVRMDGRIYPETGSKTTDGIILNPIDAHSHEYVGTKNGKVVVRSTISFPGDGQTRISHLTFLNGKQVDRTTIWKRKVTPGDAPWYGTWTDGRRTLIMQPWEDGFTIQYSWPTGKDRRYVRGSIFARFDGRQYPESKNPSVDGMVVKKIDARTIALIHFKDGKETITATVSHPADGDTRISHTTGTQPSGEKVDNTVVWRRVK